MRRKFTMGLVSKNIRIDNIPYNAKDKQILSHLPKEFEAEELYDLLIFKDAKKWLWRWLASKSYRFNNYPNYTGENHVLDWMDPFACTNISVGIVALSFGVYETLNPTLPNLIIEIALILVTLIMYVAGASLCWKKYALIGYHMYLEGYRANLHTRAYPSSSDDIHYLIDRWFIQFPKDFKLISLEDYKSLIEYGSYLTAHFKQPLTLYMLISEIIAAKSSYHDYESTYETYWNKTLFAEKYRSKRIEEIEKSTRMDLYSYYERVTQLNEQRNGRKQSRKSSNSIKEYVDPATGEIYRYKTKTELARIKASLK